MIKDTEIAIVYAASKALELLAKDPYISAEEIIPLVMISLDANADAKIMAVAAINGVVRMRREFKDLGDKQVIQKYIDEFRKNTNLAEGISS